jgi:hypothetical protein
VFFNNDWEGFAVENARVLLHLLGQGERDFVSISPRGA